MVQVEVFNTYNKKLGEITVDNNAKVKDIKKQIAIISPKLYVDRQSIRAELKGKDMKDDLTVPSLASTRKIFVKDLGPQIGWVTVFLLEYAGPFVLYGLVSLRPWIFYGDAAQGTTLSTTAWNLRPPGSKVRKIPVPDSNPLTKLYKYVSCPNYTYEFGAWLGFTIMTSCIPAGLFALAGLYQMTIWALGKHRNYKKEFSDYPKNRKAILPFII